MNRTLKHVQWWIGDSKPWTQGFLSGVTSASSISAIVLMGSAIRAPAHRRSDVDLLILYRGKRPSIRAPIEVDIRMYPVEGIDADIVAGKEIICWALQFGIAAYDPEGVWAALSESWKNRVPLPSAEEATKRAWESLKRAKEMLELGDESAADDLLLAAATQFVRARLIENKVFPASRPELPDQLRAISPKSALAQVLQDAMNLESRPQDLLYRLESYIADCGPAITFDASQTSSNT